MRSLRIENQSWLRARNVDRSSCLSYHLLSVIIYISLTFIQAIATKIRGHRLAHVRRAYKHEIVIFVFNFLYFCIFLIYIVY